MALNVHIVTPTANAWSGEANRVSIPGWLGEFEVLPNHDILLSLLKEGTTVVTDTSGQQHRFSTGGGFVEAGPDKVTLFTESCTAQ